MKKSTLGILAIMAVCAVMSYADENIAVSTESTAILQASTTGQQYEMKLVIDGKWGSGPGEFGKVYYFFNDDPLNKYNSLMLNVNSKGEIYILDAVNSRIQKFDKDGKYLLSIPVVGVADATGNSVVKEVNPVINSTIRFQLTSDPSIIGINTQIDSEDILYYYLIRLNETKGEVWKFKDDKLMEKYEAPVLAYYWQGTMMSYDPKFDSVEIAVQGKKAIYYDVKTKSVTPKNIWEERERDFRERLKNGTEDIRKLPWLQTDMNGVKVFKSVRK